MFPEELGFVCYGCKKAAAHLVRRMWGRNPTRINSSMRRTRNEASRGNVFGLLKMAEEPFGSRDKPHPGPISPRLAANRYLGDTPAALRRIIVKKLYQKYVMILHRTQPRRIVQGYMPKSQLSTPLEAVKRRRAEKRLSSLGPARDQSP